MQMMANLPANMVIHQKGTCCGQAMRGLGPLASEPRLACCGDSFRWGLDDRGQKIVMVVVRIVGFVRKPNAVEEVRLPGHGATLHTHTVDEAVFDMRSTPISAPDQPAALGELPEKREIALPRTLPIHAADNVTSQAIMVNSNRAKLRGALVEQLLLAILAAMGLVDHEVDSHAAGG